MLQHSSQQNARGQQDEHSAAHTAQAYWHAGTLQGLTYMGYTSRFESIHVGLLPAHAPVLGSSMSTTGGPPMSATATASLRLLPPEYDSHVLYIVDAAKMSTPSNRRSTCFLQLVWFLQWSNPQAQQPLGSARRQSLHLSANSLRPSRRSSRAARRSMRCDGRPRSRAYMRSTSRPVMRVRTVMSNIVDTMMYRLDTAGVHAQSLWLT